MGHPPFFVSLPALLLATTLATACGTTDETPPMAEATLAFTQDTSIYTISTEEGSTPSLLLSGYVRPSWSPDGRTFAMVRTGPPPQPFFPSNQALYLADADGGNARALAGFSYPIIETPVWSPDGASLLYLREKSGFGPPTVYTIRLAAAGGPETTLDGVLFAPLPSWSRDGSVIAVDHAGLTVLLNATSYDTVLTLPGGWPRLSPVNDDLAFREPTTGHIHLMRSDNTGARDLGVDGYPDAWSPDASGSPSLGATATGHSTLLNRTAPVCRRSARRAM